MHFRMNWPLVFPACGPVPPRLFNSESAVCLNWFCYCCWCVEMHHWGSELLHIRMCCWSTHFLALALPLPTEGILEISHSSQKSLALVDLQSLQGGGGFLNTVIV